MNLSLLCVHSLAVTRANDIILIDKFPDYRAEGFDEAAHDQQFLENNVIIRAEAKEVYFPEHWGPLSIKCCLEGTENYAIGSRFYSVNPGNFLVLNEGQHYSSYIHSKEKVSSFTINFSRDMVREVAGDVVFVERLHDKRKIGIGLERIQRLSEAVLQNKELIRESLVHLLDQLIGIETDSVGERKKVAALKSSTRSEIYKRLYFVKDYIDSSYQQDITLDELAKVAHLNSAYLLRHFRNFFSITPRQYLIKKRIEVAVFLLRQSTKSVGEICTEVGYNDISSFSKLFKYFHRRSPLQYRSQFTKRPNFFS